MPGLTNNHAGKACVREDNGEEDSSDRQAGQAAKPMSRVAAVGPVHAAAWSRPDIGVCSTAATR